LVALGAGSEALGEVSDDVDECAGSGDPCSVDAVLGSLDGSVGTVESYSEAMADARDIPELPRALRAPEPVIIVGMAAWLVATVVVWIGGWGGDRTLAVCLVGLAVGVLGTTIVLIQRAAVRRGDRTAQQGLD
jgi:hypothetical protein